MGDAIHTATSSSAATLTLPSKKDAAIDRSQKLAAAGGLLGGFAASACCILPLTLFSLGVSGAWIGNLTALAPYQTYFIVAASGFIGVGYWLVWRSSKIACASGELCRRRIPNRLVLMSLVLATFLVAAAIGLNLFAPLIFAS